MLCANKSVLEPQVSPAFAITYFFAIIVILHLKIHQSMWIQWPFFNKLKPKVIDPKMTFEPSLLRSHVWLYPGIIVPKSHGNTSIYVDTVINCVQVPQKYNKVCGYSDPFFKTLNQRSLTPRWPLTPCLLRSHVWLYPRIIVSKSHGNTSMYVDTVINFAKYHKHTTYIYTHTDSTYIHTYIHTGVAPRGGAAAPFKVSKKGKLWNMGYFHALKIAMRKLCSERASITILALKRRCPLDPKVTLPL